MSPLETFVAFFAPFVIGIVVGHLPAWFDRKRRIKKHWEALRAEIKFCSSEASGYLRDQVKAPLTRLPTIALDKSLSVLLTEGVVKEAELEVLSRFANVAQQLNRGLDEAAERAGAPNDIIYQDRLNKSDGRNRLKATRLIEDSEDGPALAEQALAVVDAGLSRHVWS